MSRYKKLRIEINCEITFFKLFYGKNKWYSAPYTNYIIFFCRINEDNSLDISFEEWRDYLLFHPSSDLADIISHWRNHTVSSKISYKVIIDNHVG